MGEIFGYSRLRFLNRCGYCFHFMGKDFAKIEVIYFRCECWGYVLYAHVAIIIHRGRGRDILKHNMR